MKRVLIFTLVLISFFAVNISAQELIVIESNNLKCNDSIRVYTPINTNEATPTLFLLHGWSGNYRNWGDKYNLQEISNTTGFRIITPCGFYNSWYLNNTDADKMQWRTFFSEELYPQMKERYNLKPELTFITGLSMGGHGAINIFIDNPALFRSAGSMSGVLNLNHTNLKDQFAPVMGEKMGRIDTESAVSRLDKLKDVNKELIITCGYDDRYVKSAREFSDLCVEQKIPHVLILSPGNHSWKYWGYALDEHLAFFAKLLDNQNMGY